MAFIGLLSVIDKLIIMIPNTVYFGKKLNSNGVDYGYARSIITDQEKVELLKGRLDDLLIKQVTELNRIDINGNKLVFSPFPLCMLTFLSIETLGRVIGDKKKIEGENKHEQSKRFAAPILNLIDQKLSRPLTKKFKINFKKLHGPSSINSINCYTDVIFKYNRNTFMHGYQARGVFIEHTISSIWILNEEEGFIVINPYLFWERFIQVYDDIFKNIVNSKNVNWRTYSIEYFNSLIN